MFSLVNWKFSPRLVFRPPASGERGPGFVPSSAGRRKSCLTVARGKRERDSGGGDGKWRINYRGGKEATAYYTTDDDDALGMARAMEVARGQQ